MKTMEGEGKASAEELEEYQRIDKIFYEVTILFIKKVERINELIEEDSDNLDTSESRYKFKKNQFLILSYSPKRESEFSRLFEKYENLSEIQSLVEEIQSIFTHFSYYFRENFYQFSHNILAENGNLFDEILLILNFSANFLIDEKKPAPELLLLIFEKLINFNYFSVNSILLIANFSKYFLIHAKIVGSNELCFMMFFYLLNSLKHFSTVPPNSPGSFIDLYSVAYALDQLFSENFEIFYSNQEKLILFFSESVKFIDLFHGYSKIEYYKFLFHFISLFLFSPPNNNDEDAGNLLKIIEVGLNHILEPIFSFFNSFIGTNLRTPPATMEFELYNNLKIIKNLFNFFEKFSVLNKELISKYSVKILVCFMNVLPNLLTKNWLNLDILKEICKLLENSIFCCSSFLYENKKDIEFISSIFNLFKSVQSPFLLQLISTSLRSYLFLLKKPFFSI